MPRNGNGQGLRFFLLIFGAIIIGLLIAILVGVWCIYSKSDIDVKPKVKVNVAAPDPIVIPPPVVNLTCPPSRSKPDEMCTKWVYAVPFACGEVERNSYPDLFSVVPAIYSWSMSVLNSLNHTVEFTKKVSYTDTGNQTAGPFFTLRPSDTLDTCEALEMNCLQILEFSEKREWEGLFKGFVSVTVYEETNLHEPPLDVFVIASSRRDPPLLIRDAKGPIQTREHEATSDTITLDQLQIKPHCRNRTVERPRHRPRLISA